MAFWYFTTVASQKVYKFRTYDGFTGPDVTKLYSQFCWYFTGTAHRVTPRSPRGGLVLPRRERRLKRRGQRGDDEQADADDGESGVRFQSF